MQYHTIPNNTRSRDGQRTNFLCPHPDSCKSDNFGANRKTKIPHNSTIETFLLPTFFHDCILTPKRRSIFKQPRYIPGTTHINFSHAFRISALSYLLKKEVLFLQLWSVYRRTLLQTTYNAITKFGLISDKKLSRKHKLKIFKKIETGKCSKKKTKM